MRSSLFRFDRSLDQAEEFVAFISAVNMARETEDLPMELQGAALSRERASSLLFRSSIISVYGALERLILDIGEFYVASLGELCEVPARLPKVVRDQHLDLSLDVLKRRKERRWHKDVDVEKYVSNLRSCMDDDNEDFQLNSLVFRSNSANFRKDSIATFMGRLGIKVDSWGPSRMGDEEEGFVLPGIGSSAEEVLDYLAEKRNEIAHGLVQSTPNLQGEQIVGLVSAIRRYGYRLHGNATAALAGVAVQDSDPSAKVVAVYEQPAGSNAMIAILRACSDTGDGADWSVGDVAVIGKIGRNASHTIDSVSIVTSIHVDGTPVLRWAASADSLEAGLRVDWAKRGRYVWKTPGMSARVFAGLRPDSSEDYGPSRDPARV